MKRTALRVLALLMLGCWALSLRGIASPVQNAQVPGTSVYLFLSSRCPCSQSYVGHLEELHRRYPEFPFYGYVSNQDEDPKAAKAYFAQQKISFPVVYDVDAKMADRFKALKTPHVFVVNREGQVLYSGGVGDRREAGEAQQLYLATVLKHLKEGSPLPYSYQRALGCYIARKGH